jgi:hypothetical protein
LTQKDLQLILQKWTQNINRADASKEEKSEKFWGKIMFSFI